MATETQQHQTKQMNSCTCFGFTALKECPVYSAVMLEVGDILEVKCIAYRSYRIIEDCCILSLIKKNCAITTHLFHPLFSVGSSESEWTGCSCRQRPWFKCMTAI